LPNLIVELFGVVSAVCGYVVLLFLLIIYVSLKRMGGSIERRHVIVIGTVAAIFFVGAAILTYVGTSVLMSLEHFS
jgi:hypothetical protein